MGTHRVVHNGERPSEVLNTAHFTQYSLRNIASRAVLRVLGRIEGQGWPVKCFLVLLSD